MTIPSSSQSRGMGGAGTPIDPRPRSRDVTDGLEKAAARSLLRAVGLTDEDMTKPQIGVGSSWNEITPCNLNLDRLALSVKEGVHAAGGVPFQFGTISVSDGIAMGHEGMHYSLVSREVITDSVETLMQAERFDGSVLLAECDKSLPAMLMAARDLTSPQSFTALPWLAASSPSTRAPSDQQPTVPSATRRRHDMARPRVRDGRR